MHITVWDEALQLSDEKVREVYPDGIARVIGDYLKKALGCEVTCTHAKMEDWGLPGELLKRTDVLIFWAHKTHGCFPDALAAQLCQRVLRGMGLIVLHSAHLSKIFKQLMGTSCTLKYRYDDYVRIWTVDPTHPIAQGLPEYFDLENEEMYGEYFDIPKPDDVVFASWFLGGNIFRGGCTWRRGYGKVFYFQPGHETDRAFYNENVLKILLNGAKWAFPQEIKTNIGCEKCPAINIHK